MSGPSPRVFISSTGKDLAPYRAAAIEICNRMDLAPVSMEFFEAMGAGATEGSRRKLDSADLYVGIFAHRYGYVEKGYEHSVTELEFDYAEELGLDRLCFMVQRDYPWPPTLIDYENLDRLKSLKQKIDSSVIRAEFTTVDDFQVKLIQALAKWRQGHFKIIQSGEPLGPGPVKNLPPQPALLIGRDAALARIKRRLGILPDSTRSSQTIIRGLPGVGKTTLVLSLAYDPPVIDAYPDGILWAALGERGIVLFKLQEWCRQLGLPESSRASTLEKTIDRLRGGLRDKKFLLLVDDVWRSESAFPFQRIRGPNCDLIFSTRFRDVARELASLPEEILVLEVLEVEHAIDLLRRIAPMMVRKYPKESEDLVRDLEGLPLSIIVAGRYLEAEVELGGSIQGMLDELAETHRLLNAEAPNDRFEPETGTTPTISLLLRRSTDRLDEVTRDRFAMLGAFAPKPATFDQEAMRHIWDVDDPLPTARALVDRGLLEPLVAQGRFQMHALLVMHARALLDAQGSNG